jgi:hypothetical protein
MVTVTILKKIDDNVFHPEKLAEEQDMANLDVSKIVLCAKACDGSLHRVNSDVGDVLSEHKTTLSNGGFQTVIGKFGDEEVHGQRFLVYPTDNKAFLIGNLFFGLKKLAKLK